MDSHLWCASAFDAYSRNLTVPTCLTARATSQDALLQMTSSRAHHLTCDHVKCSRRPLDPVGDQGRSLIGQTETPIHL